MLSITSSRILAPTPGVPSTAIDLVQRGQGGCAVERVGQASQALLCGKARAGCTDGLNQNVLFADLIGRAAIQQQPVAQVFHVVPLDHPQPQVIILAMAERGAVAAERADHVAAHHHRRMAHRAGGHQPLRGFQRGLIGMEIAAREKRAICIQFVGVGAQHGNIRVAPHMRKLHRETLGPRDIVGVHAGDQWRARFVKHAVEAGDQAAIGLVDHPDAWILCRIAVKDRRGSIAASHR